MGNVYDIWSGEPVKVKKTPPKRAVIRIIESLYQRRHQIDEIVVITVEKGTLNYAGGAAADNEYSLRSMIRWAEDTLIDNEF